MQRRIWHHFRVLFRRIIVLGVVLTAVAGCSRSSASANRNQGGSTRTTLPQTPGPGPNPCQLATSAEISKLIGVPVGNAVPGPEVPPQSCTWPIPGTDREGDSVQVAVKSTATYASGRQNKDAIPSQRVYNITMATGVGEEAFFQSSPQAGPDGTVVLAVLKDGRAYYVTLRQAGVPIQRVGELEIAIARLALGRV